MATTTAIGRLRAGAVRPAGRRLLAAALAAACCGAPPLALAQEQEPAEEPRLYLHAGAGGYLEAPPGWSHDFAFDHSLFGPEQGRLEARYEPVEDASFEIGGHGRIWRNLAVGATVSAATSEVGARVAGELPHPFHFGRMRRVDGMPEDLERVETALHLQVLLVLPVARSFTLTLFGGPTWFAVDQHLVTELRFDQVYPYDTATYAGVEADRMTGNGLGAHGGVDAAWYFSRAVGVGATFRYSRGAVELTAPGSGALDIDAGGAQASAGLRVRF